MNHKVYKNRENNLNIPPMCDENREIPTNPLQLSSYNPSYGHNHGFNYVGLRLL